MKSELGEGFEDMDWKKLDPRQYDPRRIVREALMDEKKRPANAAETLNRAKPPQKPLELGESPTVRPRIYLELPNPPDHLGHDRGQSQILPRSGGQFY